MGKVRDLTGFRSGRLVAIEFAGLERGAKKVHATWLCRCDCGNEIVVINGSLTSKNTRSCGCLKREMAHTNNLKHGGAVGGKSREYMIWKSMRERCSSPACVQYPNYGGRGIRVCDRWQRDFGAFIADMGPRPTPRHSIERIDNDGPYSPENCRWATPAEQGENKRNNRMIVHRGRAQTMTAWCRELNLNVQTVAWRLSRGADPEKALAPTPTRFFAHGEKRPGRRAAA